MNFFALPGKFSDYGRFIITFKIIFFFLVFKDKLVNKQTSRDLHALVVKYGQDNKSTRNKQYFPKIAYCNLNPRHSLVIKEWLLYNVEKVLPHPPQSRDLNPVKHLRNYMEPKLRERKVNRKN